MYVNGAGLVKVPVAECCLGHCLNRFGMSLMLDLLNMFLVYTNSLETVAIRLIFHKLRINEMEIH